MFDNTDSKDMKDVSNGVNEEIGFANGDDIVLVDDVAINGSKKIKNPNPNSIRLASNRILKNVKSKDKKVIKKEQTRKPVNG